MFSGKQQKVQTANDHQSTDPSSITRAKVIATRKGRIDSKKSPFAQVKHSQPRPAPLSERHLRRGTNRPHFPEQADLLNTTRSPMQSKWNRLRNLLSPKWKTPSSSHIEINNETSAVGVQPSSGTINLSTGFNGPVETEIDKGEIRAFSLERAKCGISSTAEADKGSASSRLGSIKAALAWTKTFNALHLLDKDAAASSPTNPVTMAQASSCTTSKRDKKEHEENSKLQQTQEVNTQSLRKGHVMKDIATRSNRTGRQLKLDEERQIRLNRTPASSLDLVRESQADRSTSVLAVRAMSSVGESCSNMTEFNQARSQDSGNGKRGSQDSPVGDIIVPVRILEQRLPKKDGAELENELQSPWGVKGEFSSAEYSDTSAGSKSFRIPGFSAVVGGLNKPRKLGSSQASEQYSLDENSDGSFRNGQSIEMLQDAFVEFSSQRTESSNTSFVQKMKRKSAVMMQH